MHFELQEVLVHYLGEPPRTDRLALHPADRMKAARALSGKQWEWVDDETRLAYYAWLASKRTGLLDGDVGFELWMDGLAAVEGVITEKSIADALAMKAIDEDAAAVMRREMERQGAGLGESPARHTPSPALPSPPDSV
jgi:hypothetical protein